MDVFDNVKWSNFLCIFLFYTNTWLLKISVGKFFVQTRFPQQICRSYIKIVGLDRYEVVAQDPAVSQCRIIDKYIMIQVWGNICGRRNANMNSFFITALHINKYLYIIQSNCPLKVFSMKFFRPTYSPWNTPWKSNVSQKLNTTR